MRQSSHQFVESRVSSSMRRSKSMSSHSLMLASASAVVLLLLMEAAQAQSANTVIQGPTVTVPGIHSSPWNIPNNLMIGNTLGGTLIVESGGIVNGTTARIGADNVTGTVTVQDAGSAWTNNGALSVGVGVSGVGQLNIVNGGSVSNTTSEVGATPGGTGIVTVSGSGSQWTNTYLALGWYGDGTVTIDNGGAVIAPVVHIGAVPASQGTLNLDGEAGNRGVITADYFMKGLGDGQTGGARVNFNGGILRASMNNVVTLASQTDWAYGFAPGDVVIGTKGAFIDSNGLSIGVSAAMEGVGALTKLGAGTLTLSGANTYSGGTAVNGGVLATSADANLGHASGPLSLDGGTLRFRTAFNLAATRSIVLNAGGGTFDTNGFNSSISQGISGSGSLTKAGAGTLTLTGANAYTGGTTISAGTLQVGNGGTSGSVSGNIVNNATLAFNRSDALTYAGNISGSGSLTKAGTGTLTLTGTNTYTGGTAVNGGVLAIGTSDASPTGPSRSAEALSGSIMPVRSTARLPSMQAASRSIPTAMPRRCPLLSQEAGHSPRRGPAA